MKGSDSMTDEQMFATRRCDQFLAFANDIRRTLASWPADVEPYAVAGYRMRAMRNMETYMSSAISWASR